MPTVLCDSGPLIALAKVGRLRLLLDLWKVVHVTAEVYQEAVALGHALGAPDALTIRLFWQKHKLPIIGVADSVLAAYQPSITLDLTEGQVLLLDLRDCSWKRKSQWQISKNIAHK